MTTQTQVSTPEPHQPWSFDEKSLASWASGDTLAIPLGVSHFPSSQPQQQHFPPISAGVDGSMNAGSHTQWSWSTDFPQITYQESLSIRNDFLDSHNSLVSMNSAPYSQGQCILGPTAPTLMGAGSRRSFPGTPTELLPRSSPRPLSAMEPIYGDSEAMSGWFGIPNSDYRGRPCFNTGEGYFR